MTTYNRQWLRDRAASFLHDASVTTEADVWVDMALSMINMMLRVKEQEHKQTYTGTPVTLDSRDFEVLRVQYNGEALEFVPFHVWDFWRDAGDPVAYTVQDGQLLIKGSTGGDVEVTTLRDVELPDDTSEHPALTAHPDVFLWGVLSYGADWKQDLELSAKYEQRMVAAINNANEVYRVYRVGEVPVMRAV